MHFRAPNAEWRSRTRKRQQIAARHGESRLHSKPRSFKIDASDDWCIMPPLFILSYVLVGAEAFLHGEYSHMSRAQNTMGDGDFKHPHATLAENPDTTSNSPLLHPRALGAWR